MQRVALAGQPGPFLRELKRMLLEEPARRVTTLFEPGSDPSPYDSCAGSAVYAAERGDHQRPGPDVEHARRFFQNWVRLGISRVVLISSAAVHEPSAHHPGMVSASRRPSSKTGSPIAQKWRELEAVAIAELSGVRSLTILRPVTVLHRGGRDYFNRLFRSGVAAVCPGFNPPLQLLAMEELGAVVNAALGENPSGVLVRHIAPTRTIPFRRALRLAGTRAVPVPRTLQRLVRGFPLPNRLIFPIGYLDYARYPWTVQDESPSGSEPRLSSARALWMYRCKGGQTGAPPGWIDEDFDDFGMDRDFIDRLAGSVFRFLHDVYWRVELNGVERIPKEGGGVLVGLHRGFMPFDAIMALHEMARLRNRYPRFLIHPGLVKFPFFSNVITRFGGVLACRENADRLLRGGEIVGVFPEGVWGAFAMYRDAYRIQRFVSDEFVRLALRHQVPILPFVTVGSAETFPILGRIDSAWWRRYAEWPFFPLTPTFPLLPLPLPSKWHTRYLEPVPVQKHPPQAVDDPVLVRAISDQVRRAMEADVSSIVSRRRSWFRGDVFDPSSR